MIADWKDTLNFKRTILIEGPTFCLLTSDAFKKHEGQESWKKQKENPLRLSRSPSPGTSVSH